MSHKIILVGVLMIILMCPISLCSDFTPSGNINMRSYYNLTNLNYLSGFSIYGNINANGYDIYGADQINATSIYINGDFVNLTSFADTNETTRVEALWGENTTIHGRIDDINTTANTASEYYENASQGALAYAWGYYGENDSLILDSNTSWITDNQLTYNNLSISDIDSALGNATDVYNIIVAFGYYNSTDFVITDYFTKTEIENLGYYNSSDFSISNYYNKTEILAFNYYNSSDFDISDYVTSAVLSSYNYYNSSDFDISDYALDSKVDSLGNWSNDKSDYALLTQLDNDSIIRDTNTSWITDNQFTYNNLSITDVINGVGNATAVNETLQVEILDRGTNDTALGGRIDSVNTTENIEILGFNITTDLKTYFDTLYYAISNPSEFLNITGILSAVGNATAVNDTLQIEILDRQTNDTLYNNSIRTYADATFLNQTDEGNLNVNSSEYWDALDSPSDINAGDITDDNTYATTTGDNFTGNVIISDNLTVNGYYSGQPLDGGIGSGIIWCDDVDSYGNVNITIGDGRNATYPNMIIREVTTNNEVYVCNITSATVNPTNNQHSMYYVNTS